MKGFDFDSRFRGLLRHSLGEAEPDRFQENPLDMSPAQAEFFFSSAVTQLMLEGRSAEDAEVEAARRYPKLNAACKRNSGQFVLPARSTRFR